MKNLICSLVLSLILLIPAMASVEVSAPSQLQTTEETFTVPISVDNAYGTISYQFHLGFTPSISVPTACSTEGTIANDFTVFCNIPFSGQLNIVAYSAYALTEDSGTILNITFQSAKITGCSKLKFTEVMFFDESGLVESTWKNGQICVLN